MTEIAFFGGSFTAIDRSYMISLLEAAKPYLNGFYGIRISTRPDYIDGEVLSILKDYGVTAIELGAQSMDNSVLELNERGHTASDVENRLQADKVLRLFIGAADDDGALRLHSRKRTLHPCDIVALEPDTVRIYPTVIMKNTELAELYLQAGRSSRIRLKPR